MADAPELILRRTLAGLLDSWGLATYQPNPAQAFPENGIRLDGIQPTSVKAFTSLSSPPSIAEGRADMVYRVQFFTRREGGLTPVEAWANSLNERLDHKEYLPSILGISWAWEMSRTYFDRDPETYSSAAVTYGFRGRRQTP